VLYRLRLAWLPGFKLHCDHSDQESYAPAATGDPQILRGGSHELECLSFGDPGATVFNPDEFELPGPRYRHEERNERIGSRARVQAGSEYLSARKPGLESVQQEPRDRAAVGVSTVAGSIACAIRVLISITSPILALSGSLTRGLADITLLPASRHNRRQSP
jgi:hypothetical protein